MQDKSFLPFLPEGDHIFCEVLSSSGFATHSETAGDTWWHHRPRWEPLPTPVLQIHTLCGGGGSSHPQHQGVCRTSTPSLKLPSLRELASECAFYQPPAQSISLRKDKKRFLPPRKLALTTSVLSAP